MLYHEYKIFQDGLASAPIVPFRVGNLEFVASTIRTMYIWYITSCPWIRIFILHTGVMVKMSLTLVTSYSKIGSSSASSLLIGMWSYNGCNWRPSSSYRKCCTFYFCSTSVRFTDSSLLYRCHGSLRSSSYFQTLPSLFNPFLTYKGTPFYIVTN